MLQASPEQLQKCTDGWLQKEKELKYKTVQYAKTTGGWECGAVKGLAYVSALRQRWRKKDVQKPYQHGEDKSLVFLLEEDEDV